MWIRIKMTSGIRVRTKTFQICKFFFELFRKTIFQGSYQRWILQSNRNWFLWHGMAERIPSSNHLAPVLTTST